MKISVIIPTLNEAESIGQVLAEIPGRDDLEIMVVDGGSSDSTVEIARSAGAIVLQELRRGYGRACAAGAQASRGEVLVFMDGDGADDPARIPDLVHPVLAGEAQLVLSTRLAGRIQAKAMPWHQRLGNRLAVGWLNLLYGQALTDLGPYRAIRRSDLFDLGMEEMSYGWPTEMIVKAARRGWRIHEIPVEHRARLGGKSKISGTVRGSFWAAFFILRTIARYA